MEKFTLDEIKVLRDALDDWVSSEEAVTMMTGLMGTIFAAEAEKDGQEDQARSIQNDVEEIEEEQERRKRRKQAIAEEIEEKLIMMRREVRKEMGEEGSSFGKSEEIEDLTN